MEIFCVDFVLHYLNVLIPTTLMIWAGGVAILNSSDALRKTQVSRLLC